MSKNIVEINTLNISNAVVIFERVSSNFKLILVLADILRTYYVTSEKIKKSREFSILKNILLANNNYLLEINSKAEELEILDIFNITDNNKFTIFDLSILFSVIENNEVVYKRRTIISFQTISSKKFLKNYQKIIDFNLESDYIDGIELYDVLLSLDYYVTYVKTITSYYLS